ncbi:MAG: zinc ribbon domain-containing protein [Candidatus Geothermincolia bacterium]
MFCGQCGKEIPEGKSFCTSCGAPVVKKETPEAAAPVAAPAAVQAAPVVPAPAAPKKRKTWPIIAGVVGILVVVAVVLVLVLVVFKGSSPTSAVASFFKGIENKDSAAVMKTIDTAWFKGNSELESTFKKEVLATMPEGVKFTGLQYSTSVSGAKGTVNVTKGTINYTENGKKQSVDITKLDGGNKYDMVKVNGTWYISPTTFGAVFASSFKDAADKVFNESLEPKSLEIEQAFKSLSALMSAQPAPSAQQLNAQLAQVEAVVKDYKSICDKAKAEYEKIVDLNGTGIEDHKKYAQAAIGFIDTSIEVFDESIAFLKYVTDVKAQTEAGATPDMNAYNQKTTEYSQKVGELEKKLSDYQSQMSELEKKLQ